MTWLFHMIMELWLKGPINHFLLLNGLNGSLLMPLWNICFLQKVNLYLNYSMAKKKRGEQKHHPEICLIVAENLKSKSGSSRIKEAIKLVPFSVSCNRKCKAANLRHPAEFCLVLLSVYFPIPYTLSGPTCRFKPATDPEPNSQRGTPFPPFPPPPSTQWS